LLRIGPSLGIPAVLRELGEDPEEILAECGFDPSLFEHPDNQISLCARNRLVAHCVERTGCRHFGLLVGQQVNLRNIGVLGLLMKYSCDVEEALRHLIRYQRSLTSGTTIALEKTPSSFTGILSYHIPATHPASDQIGDGVMAGLTSILRSFCGERWKPSEVWLAHGKPADIKPFRDFFRCTLDFSGQEYAIVFPAHWLNTPLAHPDDDLLHLLRYQVEANILASRDDFVCRVREILHKVVTAADANADHIAKLLAIPTRTMKRRLQQAGTSFQALLDETRFELAQNLLADNRMSIYQIAECLGYADPATFTRAFRRWSGLNPNEWRTEKQSLSGKE